MSDATLDSKGWGVIGIPVWRAVAAMFFLNGALFGAWASRIPAVKTTFGLDAGTLGLLLLALSGGAIASFPLAGMLSERLGPARLTRWLAILYGPALIAIGFSDTLALVTVSIVLFGAIHGAMDVAMNGWGAQVETRIGRPVMSRFHAMFSLGAGVGAMTGAVAAGGGLAPAGHFLIVSAFLVPGGLAMAAVPWSADPSKGRPATSGPRLAMPRGALILVGLVALGVSLGEGALADWSAVFLVAVAASTDAMAALGYAVFSAAMFTARLAGDVIVRRFGAQGAVGLSGTIATVGIVLAVVVGTVPAAFVGFALMGLGYAVVMPVVFSRAARDPHTPPGYAIASVAVFGYGGMLLGPPLVGFVADWTSLRIAFGGLAILSMLTVILSPTLRDPS